MYVKCNRLEQVDSFYRERHMCMALYCYRNVACPSVRLSVCDVDHVGSVTSNYYLPPSEGSEWRSYC